jgi:glycosyltransferase involved in cell wall biosynthesis
VEWPVYSFRSRAALKGAFDLVRYVRRNAIRIVHTWDYPLTTFAIPLTRLATGACAVASQRSERSLIPAGYRRMLPLIDRLSHAIVVNCRFLEGQLLGEGVPASKLRVCYNGIDLPRFERETVAHPLTVGVVCALRSEKGLETLLEAFSLIQAAAPELRLLIVGDGPERASLERRAGQLGIREVCHFEPATSNVAYWLSQIDLFVLPSRSEAFSNSLTEAMACGCALVASDAGGNPEQIRHGETGWIFPAGDAQALAVILRAALDDAPLRARLAEAGAQDVRRRFSAAASVQRMQEIYLDLIDPRKRSS